jgi:hypothetical protein
VVLSSVIKGFVPFAPFRGCFFAFMIACATRTLASFVSLAVKNSRNSRLAFSLLPFF